MDNLMGFLNLAFSGFGFFFLGRKKYGCFFFFLVIAILIYGSKYHLENSIKISYSSKSDSSAQEYFAGEPLKFTLKGDTPIRVNWVFEENFQQAQESSIEIEHIFPFDEKIPVGQTALKRIDAFYSNGEKFSNVFEKVKIKNRQFAAKMDFTNNSQLEFSGDSNLANDWILGNVEFAKFNDGKFSIVGFANKKYKEISIDHSLLSEIITHIVVRLILFFNNPSDGNIVRCSSNGKFVFEKIEEPGQFSANLASVAHLFDYDGIQEFKIDTEKNKDNWVFLEFVNKSNFTKKTIGKPFPSDLLIE